MKTFGDNVVHNPVFACESQSVRILIEVNIHQYAITGLIDSSCAALLINLVRSAFLSVAGIVGARIATK